MRTRDDGDPEILSPDPLLRSPAFSGSTEEFSEHLRLSADPVSGLVSIQLGVFVSALRFSRGLAISGSALFAGSGGPTFPLLHCLSSLRPDGRPT